MRTSVLFTLALLTVPAVSSPVVVAAQTAAQTKAVCPAGEVTRVRQSKLKPGKTMADFDTAVAAHKAWYKTKGYKILMRVAPVLRWQDGAPMVSKDEVMTFATGDAVPRDKQDQAWADYVALYRAASDMTLEQVVCMPKRG